MRKLGLILLFSTLAYGQQAWADRTISGRVTDSDGGSLIGVSILVKGTVTGSVTDVDGRFSVIVPDGSNELIFSYTGFATQEITLDSQNVVDVMLDFENSYLETASVSGISDVRIVNEFNGPTVGLLDDRQKVSTMIPQHLFGVAQEAIPEAFSGSLDLQALNYQNEPYVVGFWPATWSAIAVNMLTGDVLALIDNNIQPFTINELYFDFIASQELDTGDLSLCQDYPENSSGLSAIYFINELNLNAGNAPTVLTRSEEWEWEWEFNNSLNWRLNRAIRTFVDGTDQIFDGTEDFFFDDSQGPLVLTERTADFNVFVDGNFAGQVADQVMLSTPQFWQPVNACPGYKFLTTTTEETILSNVNGVTTTEVNTTGPQIYLLNRNDVMIPTNIGVRNTTETMRVGLDFIEINFIDKETGYPVKTERLRTVFDFYNSNTGDFNLPFEPTVHMNLIGIE